MYSLSLLQDGRTNDLLELSGLTDSEFEYDSDGSDYCPILRKCNDSGDEILPSPKRKENAETPSPPNKRLANEDTHFLASSLFTTMLAIPMMNH
ncbi:hypothetical protein RRG08_053098 [Elysia crispata]|uniref:Uncharacterized protein n=1 Tax=Elysia crispata TaxID=231223 RepID=A0AAE0Y1S4_9GAST|nr:hypothetical protein RRG08_053098 [Elysia crispata]